METVILALIGITLVVVIARIVKSKAVEVVLFGAIFTLFEIYHFYGEELFSFPVIPQTVTIITVAGLMFWTVLRIMGFVGRYVPLLKVLPSAILGR